MKLNLDEHAGLRVLWHVRPHEHSNDGAYPVYGVVLGYVWRACPYSPGDRSYWAPHTAAVLLSESGAIVTKDIAELQLGKRAEPHMPAHERGRYTGLARPPTDLE